MPVANYDDVRRVSVIVHELLDELGAVGYPKTSGGKDCTYTCGFS